jgi:sulfatase maturation enzyme AslB (radical SAM superfamily)
MNLALTNYGLRYASERFQDGPQGVDCSAADRLLLDLQAEILVPYQDTLLYNQLLDEGLVELAPDAVSREQIALRYRRNPLEHVETIIFEVTTRCNFNCRHCYNAGVDPATEEDMDALKSADDVFVGMGVRRFAFVGGEVSRYGDGWLEVTRHMGAHDEIEVGLFTNGWWLGQSDFVAAGRRYPNETAYLEDLRDNGLTHVVFSLDGPQAVHDHSRRRPGLHRRILESFDRVRLAGLEPAVSLLVRGDQDPMELARFLADLAGRLYWFPPGTGLVDKLSMLGEDPANTLSNLIDIGNGVSYREDRFGLFDMPDDLLYCKGFFRPHPTLTIKANGELATCRVTNAGEGYGNIHRQDLMHILNHMQDQFVFKLHAERRLGEYRRCVDPSLFGVSFGHLCTLRAILTLIARRMQEEAVDPEDREAIQRINREVARYTGHAR